MTNKNPIHLNYPFLLYFLMALDKSVDWRAGLVLTLMGFALLALGSSILHIGAKHEDVLLIVRGGIVFIAGVAAIVYFGIFMHWQINKHS
jgi:hypothetical protein